MHSTLSAHISMTEIIITIRLLLTIERPRTYADDLVDPIDGDLVYCRDGLTLARLEYPIAQRSYDRKEQLLNGLQGSPSLLLHRVHRLTSYLLAHFAQANQCTVVRDQR